MVLKNILHTTDEKICVTFYNGTFGVIATINGTCTTLFDIFIFCPKIEF